MFVICLSLVLGGCRCAGYKTAVCFWLCYGGCSLIMVLNYRHRHRHVHTHCLSLHFKLKSIITIAHIPPVSIRPYLPNVSNCALGQPPPVPIIELTCNFPVAFFALDIIWIAMAVVRHSQCFLHLSIKKSLASPGESKPTMSTA